mmetsp:Transcript_27758/g.63966  ORF Transcript_27758/g.63966 Transcript_27758/m.63966 type:complete len:222 (+) Transcript_27758:350-1015(+)
MPREASADPASMTITSYLAAPAAARSATKESPSAVTTVTDDLSTPKCLLAKRTTVGSNSMHSTRIPREPARCIGRPPPPSPTTSAAAPPSLRAASRCLPTRRRAATTASWYSNASGASRSGTHSTLSRFPPPARLHRAISDWMRFRLLMKTIRRTLVFSSSTSSTTTSPCIGETALSIMQRTPKLPPAVKYGMLPTTWRAVVGESGRTIVFSSSFTASRPP